MMRIAAVLCVMALWTLTPRAGAENRFDTLLASVPADANALMLVDVPALLDTDIANEQNWAIMVDLHAQARDFMIPPAATLWARATHYDLTSSMALWDLSLMQLKAMPDLDVVASREGGRTDTIGSARAVWSPRDMYLVDLGKNNVGAYSPASRQQVTRWFTEAQKRKAPALSPYLSEVVKSADLKTTQFVLAMDAEGALSPREIKPDLAAFKSLEGKNINLDQLTDAIASIRGVTLTVAFTDKAAGMLTVHFGKDVAFMQPIARDLVIEVLRRRGMLVIEVQSWEAQAQGNTITLSGPLYSSGLRRLSSFFDAPTPNVATVDATPKAQEKPVADAPVVKPMDPVAASQAYFKAVTAYLDDVYKAEEADSTQLGDAALWMEKYARKIEQLPIAGVDEQLLDWSAYVSAQLVRCSTRLKEVKTNSAKRMAAHSNFYDMDDTGGNPTALVGVRNRDRNYSRSNSDGYHYDSNNYNYSSHSGYDVYEVQVSVDRYRSRYQAGERKQIGIEEKASGAQDALAIIGELKGETARTRRDMTKKYNVEF